MPFISVVRILFLLILLLFLQACSEKPSVSKTGDQVDIDRIWLERQKDLAAILGWSLKGRIALRTDDNGWSATLNWRQIDQQYTMRIIAPLGLGTYEIRQDAEKITLLTDENKVFKAKNAESLMLENLGWSVPVSGLRYWIRGIPDPNHPIDSFALNDEAQLVNIKQSTNGSTWEIRFLSYKSVDQYTLPGKLVLTNSKAKITILAKQWNNLL